MGDKLGEYAGLAGEPPATRVNRADGDDVGLVLAEDPDNTPGGYLVREQPAWRLRDSQSGQNGGSDLAFYTEVGKKPIHLQVEVKGHLVNRLQAALWQEMIYLVSTGAASAAQVDTAMRYAIGPRWAAQGPFVNLHLSGGAGGLRRVLESLGPAMQSWWRDLGHVTLTPQIIDSVVASAEDLIAAEHTGHLASRRDAAVARILQAAIDKPDPQRDCATPVL